MVGVHAWRRGVCHPLMTRCLNRAWSMILQPILLTCTEEACEDRLLCDGKIQLKHAPAAKRVT